MGCGMKLVSVLLVVFNLLLFLFGLALIAVGLWSVIDKAYAADVIGDDLFSAAAYMVIIAGVILLAVSVLGFCAIRKEQQRLVLIYFILLLVICLTLVLTAILAVVFRAELEDQMADAMRGTLLSGYGAQSSITAAWDRLQQHLRCCGVRASTSWTTGGNEDLEVTRQDSWLLFQHTNWYKDARLQNIEPVELVPQSCCVYDDKIGGFRDVLKCQTWQLGPPGNLRFAIFNDALYYEGCYEKAQKFIGAQADILVGCTFAFAFCMIAGLVLTFMLYRLIGEQTRVMRD